MSDDEFLQSIFGRLNTIQVDLNDVLDELLEELHKPAEEFRLRWPTEYAVITQPFRNNKEYYSTFKCNGDPLLGHEGIDIKAPHGSPILSCAPGKVYRVHTDPDSHSYGIHVRVAHPSGHKTIYGHLLLPTVKLGQVVYSGQMIGRADNTGNSYGSHLHLTVKFPGATERGETDFPCDIIDPTPLLVLPDGNG